MKQGRYTLQMTTPKMFCQSLGKWVRALRQREQWTQAMLASRAGVPVFTLSRFEQKGAGSIDFLAKVLFATGALNSMNEVIQGRLRLATFPTNLSTLLPAETDALPKRIRRKKAGK